MDNKKKLLLMEKRFISKRQRFYKLPNPQLLVIILHKKRRYGMTEYNQSWFENIRLQRYEVLINEIGRKKIIIGPQTFGYFFNVIRPGIEKIWFFNWDCLS